MSPQDSTEKLRGVQVARPRADIYTALLGISLGCILVGTLLLALEWMRLKT